MAGRDLVVRAFEPGDRAWAEELIARHQGSSRTVRLGEVIEPCTLDGLVAVGARRPVGLLTYRAGDQDLEVVTLHATEPGSGAGSALLRAVTDLARDAGLRRVWLVTTNDNLDALGFYQRQGLRLCALHAGSVDADRRLKPEIPAVNPDNGIEIHDLLELEHRL